MGIEVKRVGVRRTNCSCSMPGVWRALSFVRGALVVFHSPRPCAHIAHGILLRVAGNVPFDAKPFEGNFLGGIGASF